MKKIFTIAGALLVLAAPTLPAHGQASQAVVPTPEYGGFSWPTAAGVLRYSLSGSERFTFGYAGTGRTVTQSTVNGEVGVTTGSVIHPLSLQYTGGFLIATNGGQTGYFQDMDVTQSYNLRNWMLQAADSSSILPEYEGAGTAGIAGLGNTGVPPPPTTSPQNVLFTGGTRVSNNATGTLTRILTGSTSLHGNGTYGIQRFLGNSTNRGIEDNSTVDGGGLTHRIDALTNVTADYNYTRYRYLTVSQPLTVQVFEFGYTRDLTRKVKVSVAGGPERVGASALTMSPAAWNFEANASAMYTTETWTGSVFYQRAVNEGSGVTLGTRSNSVGGTASILLGRQWHAGSEVNYYNNQGLETLTTTPYSTQSVVVSGDLTREIHRYYSIFVSYSDQRQTASGHTQSNLAYTGNIQTLGFGVSYTPRAINLGRK